jgi:plastocyanin
MFSWIARSSFLLSIISIAGAMGLLYAGMQVPGEAVAVNSVSVGDNFFEPGSITVQAGSAVEWKNTGNLPHTATAGSGAFDSGMLKKDKTFSQVFEVPGAFSYVCSFHPEMVGSVVVEAAAQPTPAPTAAPAPAAVGTTQQPAARVAGTLPVGGGPPLDAGMARGAIALVVIGIAFAALGGGAMTLAARTKQDAC